MIDKDERLLRQRQAEIDVILQRRGLLGGAQIRALETFSARIRTLLTPPEPIDALDDEIQRYVTTLRQLPWVENLMKSGVFPEYQPKGRVGAGKAVPAQ